MNLVRVKCTLKDSLHDLGAKDTDLVEDLSGAKVREEVMGEGPQTRAGGTQCHVREDSDTWSSVWTAAVRRMRIVKHWN